MRYEPAIRIQPQQRNSFGQVAIISQRVLDRALDEPKFAGIERSGNAQILRHFLNRHRRLAYTDLDTATAHIPIAAIGHALERIEQPTDTIRTVEPRENDIAAAPDATFDDVASDTFIVNVLARLGHCSQSLRRRLRVRSDPIKMRPT